jgi:hypothetical protein
LNVRPASSVVRFPFASYVGVVAPPMLVISFCLLCPRVCALPPSVVRLSQFPRASKSKSWLRLAAPTKCLIELRPLFFPLSSCSVENLVPRCQLAASNRA